MTSTGEDLELSLSDGESLESTSNLVSAPNTTSTAKSTKYKAASIACASPTFASGEDNEIYDKEFIKRLQFVEEFSPGTKFMDSTMGAVKKALIVYACAQVTRTGSKHSDDRFKETAVMYSQIVAELDQNGRLSEEGIKNLK